MLKGFCDGGYLLVHKPKIGSHQQIFLLTFWTPPDGSAESQTPGTTFMATRAATPPEKAIGYRLVSSEAINLAPP
jgi:hypothetical protein